MQFGLVAALLTISIGLTLIAIYSSDSLLLILLIIALAIAAATIATTKIIQSRRYKKISDNEYSLSTADRVSIKKKKDEIRKKLWISCLLGLLAFMLTLPLSMVIDNPDTYTILVFSVISVAIFPCIFYAILFDTYTALLHPKRRSEQIRYDWIQGVILALSLFIYFIIRTTSNHPFLAWTVMPIGMILGILIVKKLNKNANE